MRCYGFSVDTGMKAVPMDSPVQFSTSYTKHALQRKICQYLLRKGPCFKVPSTTIMVYKNGMFST
jgi:hypothetical protein